MSINDIVEVNGAESSHANSCLWCVSRYYTSVRLNSWSEATETSIKTDSNMAETRNEYHET